MRQGGICDVCGVVEGAVEACLRVPELGRDGRAGGRPRSNSTRLVGLVLASADLAASVKLTRSASPLPPLLAAWQPPTRIDIRTTVRHSRWRISTSMLGIQRPAAIVHPLHSPEGILN